MTNVLGLDDKEVSDKVSNVVHGAIKETEGRFDNFTRVSIQYRADGKWHDVELSCRELLNLLHTGTYDERQVVAVECVVVTADEDQVRFVYDFMNLHTEKNPWRML